MKNEGWRLEEDPPIPCGLRRRPEEAATLLTSCRSLRANIPGQSNKTEERGEGEETETLLSADDCGGTSL